MELTKKQKRSLKRLAVKYLIKEIPQPNIDGLLIHRADGDHDHETHQFFMKVKDADTALKSLCRFYPVYGLDIGPTMYDCTGQPFCEPADIREVTPGRYMVHLYIRYDV